MSLIKEIKLEQLWAFQGIQSTSEIPFMFRWLLFLDQCHDFLENVARNNWQGRIGEVYNIIVQSYKDDINWLINTLVLNYTLNDVLKMYNIPDVTDATNTAKLVEKIDTILQQKLQIKPISSSDIFREGGSCSSSLKAMIKIVNSRVKGDDIATYNLTVDADNTGLNYAALILFLCDEISRTNKPKTLKIWTTNATSFDSASGSTVVNHFKKLSEALQIAGSGMSRGNIKTQDDISTPTIKITYNKITLLEFKYDGGGDSLKLLNIFGKIIPDGADTLKKQFASVNKITSNSLDIPDTKLKLWFKTIGDLGQICMYYQLTKSLSSAKTPNFFITFDKICSRISSLFLPYTMLEDKSSINVISPITFFMKGDEVNEVTSAASVLVGLKRPRSYFGKSNNKIKDLSYDVLKSKLKMVGINVTKITASGKKAPLTKKEMQQKASIFKKLQLRAKMYNIKLMYKSKRGYVYKTHKRLTNELNRKLGKTSFG